jgi:tellurite resistance protein TerC
MIFVWTGFILFILAMLALDLGVFHRKAHVIRVKEALGWSAGWISLGLLFSVFVYFGYDRNWFGLGGRIDPVDGTLNTGAEATIKYLTGYLLEKSLSVDNIFVIALIFSYFAVPPMYQHRVLFWGILGALVMRGLMIWIGVELILRYHWVIYVFGAFLIFTAIKMLLMKTHGDMGQNVFVRMTRKVFAVTDDYHGKHFLIKQGAWKLTPLSLALVMVETTDLIFAVDSIPAIFAITGDAFLVFTSNVFAILGLRSLYFALAGMIDKFRYLKLALAIILAVVGVKMLTASWLKAIIGPSFNLWLLAIIGLILAGGIIASINANKRQERAGQAQRKNDKLIAVP